MEKRRRALKLTRAEFNASTKFQLVDPASRWRLPFSDYRKQWEIALFCVTLGSMFQMPWTILLRDGKAQDMKVSIAVYLVDLFYLMNFRYRLWHFGEAADETAGSKPREVAIEYLQTWRFMFDFFGALPFHAFYDLTFSLAGFVQNPLIELYKIVRWSNFFYGFRYLRKYISRKHGALNSSVPSMFQVFLMMLVLLNLFSSLWLKIACPSYPCSKEDSWIVAYGFQDLSITQQFIRSLYIISQTFFTVGYGDFTPASDIELTFINMVMLLGVFLYALLIAVMTSVIANQDAGGVEFKITLEHVRRYLTLHRVPREEIEAVETYFEYLWLRQGSKSEQEILNLLPIRPDGDQSLFRNVTLLQPEKIQPKGLHYLVKHMEPRTYPPNATVVRADTPKHEIIIIRHGFLQVFSSRKTKFSMLFPGEYLGIVQTLADVKHEFSYVTQVFTEVIVISREVLYAVLQQTSLDQLNIVQEEIEKLVSNCLRSGLALSYDQTLQGLVRRITCPVIREALIEHLASTQSSRNKCRALEMNLRKGTKCMTFLGDDVKRKRARDTIALHSTFRLVWDACMVMVIIYSTLAIPIRIQFGFSSGQLRDFQPSLILDYVLDIFFWVDIYLMAYYFEYEEYEHGTVIVVTDKAKITEKYLHSRRFKADLVSSLPYSLLSVIFSIHYYPVWRLARMLKALYISSYLDMIKGCLDYRGIRVSSTVLVLFKLVLSVAIVTIITSCIWSMLHVSHGDLSLLSAVYWSLTTMTTIGFGDITAHNTPDMVYSIVVIIIGTTLGAGTVANIATIVHNAIVSEDNFDHRVTCIETFLKHMDLPVDTVERCRQMLEHNLKTTEGLNTTRILDEIMPLPIRERVLQDMHIRIVRKAELFQFSELSNGFLYTVAGMLETESATRGEYLVSPGSVLRGMYVIKSGQVKVSYSQDIYSRGAPLVLVDGATFGEYALFDAHSTNAVAVATAQTSLVVLPSEKFEPLKRFYPEVFLMMQELAMELRDPSLHLPGTFKRSDSLKRDRKTNRWVDISGNNFIHNWHALMLLVFVANSLITPLGITFKTGRDNYFLLALVYLTDLLLVADMVFHANVFPIVHFDTVIRGKSHIQVRYLYGPSMGLYATGLDKVWHVLFDGDAFTDLIAFFPFEIFALGIQLWGLEGIQILFIFRLNRMLHGLKLKKYFAAFDNQMHRYLKLGRNLLKTGRLTYLLFLACHWFGCIWFLIADTSTYETNWASDSTSQDLLSADPLTQYVASIYWSSFTLTTVGYGDIYPTNSFEQMFATFVLICGTCAYTLIISNLEEIIAQVDVTSTLFQQKMSKVYDYAKMRQLKPDVAEKLTLYMNGLRQRTAGKTPGQMLQMFPKRNRHDIVQQSCYPILQNNALLKGLFDQHLVDFIDLLVPEVYVTGDLVFEIHSFATHFIFLVNGTLEFLSESNSTLQMVQGPSPIGELQFLTEALCEFSCKARTTCNAFIMDRETYDGVLSKYGISPGRILRTGSIVNNVLGGFGASKKHKMFAVTASKVKQGKQRTVYYPNSLFKRLWGVLMIIVTLYNTFGLPFRWAFMYPERFATTMDEENASCYWLLADIFFDIPNYINIVLNLLYFVRVHDEELVDQPDDIRKAYLRSNFAFDVLITFPIDLIVYIAGVRHAQLLSFLRCMRLLNFSYMTERFNDIISLLDEIGFRFDIGAWASVKMFSMVIVLAHWCGCGYFFVAWTNNFTNSWTESLELNQQELITQYTFSLYWSVYTVTTVGFGDIKPVSINERLFSIVAMFIAAMLCDSGLTAVLTAMIDTQDAKAADNVARVECITKYMEYRSYPKRLEKGVQDYLKYNSLEQAGVDENEFLATLSPPMRSVIVNSLCFGYMRRLEIFLGLRSSMMRTIIAHMYSRTFLPRETLCRAGEKGKAMFCIIRGMVQVVTLPSEQIIVHRRGNTIGTFDKTEQYTIRSLGFTEVFVLKAAIYHRFLKSAKKNDRKRERKSVAVSGLKPRIRRRFSASEHEDYSVGHHLINVVALLAIWQSAISFFFRFVQYSLTSGAINSPIWNLLVDIFLHSMLFILFLIQDSSDRLIRLMHIVLMFPYPIAGYFLEFSRPVQIILKVPALIYLLWTPKYLHSLSVLYELRYPKPIEADSGRESLSERRRTSVVKPIDMTEIMKS